MELAPRPARSPLRGAAWIANGLLSLGGVTCLIALGAASALNPGHWFLSGLERVLMVQIAVGLVGLGLGLPLLGAALIRVDRPGLSLLASGGVVWVVLVAWVIYAETSPVFPYTYVVL